MNKATTMQAPETESPVFSTQPFAAPETDSLPEAYAPRPYDGTFPVDVIPGYVASFWRDTPLDLLRGREAGIYFPRLAEGFFPRSEQLHANAAGFAVFGDLAVGVEKAEHHRQRAEAEARKATAFEEALKRSAGQKDAANPQAAYLARFSQTVEEREITEG